MELLDELKRAANLKQRECRITAHAYSATLSALKPANFVLVVGAALLSLIAGATILVDNGLLTKIQSGVLALLSGAFTIVHSKLGCEQYQGECKKLLSFYRGMAEDYTNLHLQPIIDAGEFHKRFFELNNQFSAAVKSSTAFPFNWATSIAKINFE